MRGVQIIQKLREESFNEKTERILEAHPYIKAAEEGTLTLSQRRAFAREQYAIQLSDATSFAFLAGHRDFTPSSLSGASVPGQPAAESTQGGTKDLFQYLLGGEIYAAPLLLAYAGAVGLDENALRRSQISSHAQAYPSYWARLALSGNRAAAAAACAVNFPAWGAMCKRLLTSLGCGDYGYCDGEEDAGLAFVKFFATPIEDLDRMAAAIIDEEDVKYEDVVNSVRLLQEYEIMFWDAVFEQ